MKQYIFEVVINEGSDEFWENLSNTGCDELTSQLKDMLSEYGFDDSNTKIKLREYKDFI